VSDGFGLQVSFRVSASFFGFADVARAFIRYFLTPFFLPFLFVATVTVEGEPQEFSGPTPAAAGRPPVLAEARPVGVQPAGTESPTQADTWKVQDPPQALADAVLMPSVVNPGLSLVTSNPA